MTALRVSHLASAAIGGLIVAGGLLLSGVVGNRITQTTVYESPVSAQPNASASGLTAHDIYQRYAPAVVFVQAKLIAQVPSPFDLFHARASPSSTGSGFVVDRRGDILTTYHLIDGADRGHGVTVRFANASVHPATVIAVDPSDDLAVLRVNPRRMPPVIPVRLGDSTTVRVGDPTLAIGNPFGVDRTLTSGIVSALQHEIEAADGQMIDNVIQTDQPLSEGNSGGPLLDAEGRVVGVNSQVSAAGASQAVTFAIPIDTAYVVLSRVIHEQAIEVAYLGVSGGRAGQTTRPGVTIGAVAPGGPAAQGGVLRGDVVERVDGLAVDSLSDVQAIVSTFSPGQTVSMLVRRDGRRRMLAVRLGARRVPTPDG